MTQIKYLNGCIMAKRHADYANVRTIVLDFLLPLFGDDYPIDSFTPKCLKQLRETRSSPSDSVEAQSTGISVESLPSFLGACQRNSAKKQRTGL
jgi:hypothetical protein